MPTPQPTSSLTISLTPEHLGFLAHLYPNTEPEDALIKLLDRARSRAIRRAEQVRVLQPDQGESEGLEEKQETIVSQVCFGRESDWRDCRLQVYDERSRKRGGSRRNAWL